MDIDNRFNKIVPSFILFSSEFFPGDKLIDGIPNCFSFYFSNRKSEESLRIHLCNLNNITL